MVTVNDVCYICDRKKCSDCSYPECMHTTDVTHAASFVEYAYDKSKDIHYYREEPIIMAQFENTQSTTIDNPMNVIDPVETREISEEEANEAWKKQQFARRRTKQFYELIKTIFSICNLSGFRVEGHIRIKDLKTGKVYE